MINTKETKIILRGSIKWSVLPTAFSALTLYGMGADAAYINVATGINSAFGFQLAAMSIIGAIYLGIVALSFDRRYARWLIEKAKICAFASGFILVNKILTPVLFIIAASVISSELKWIPISLLLLAFPYFSIVLALLSVKIIFRGLRKESYYLKPLSIA